jgi:DNA-binding response OmpR family regulator
MPDLDGFELRKRFRPLYDKTPVLYISGHAAESQIVQERLMRLQEPCLLKPFTQTALTERIQAILGPPASAHGSSATAA